MDTISAFAAGLVNQGRPLMVFDWDKAANLIRERKPKVAEAGLQGDWEWTGGCIYQDGHIVPIDDTYTYLSSTWATPQLSIDDDTVDCFIFEEDMPEEWGGRRDAASVYWPESARAILESQSDAD